MKKEEESAGVYLIEKFLKTVFHSPNLSEQELHQAIKDDVTGLTLYVLRLETATKHPHSLDGSVCPECGGGLNKCSSCGVVVSINSPNNAQPPLEQKTDTCPVCHGTCDDIGDNGERIGCFECDDVGQV